MQYKVFASFNLNKVSSSTGSVVDKVNDIMSKFGFQEKLELRSEHIEIAVMTSDRLLLAEELQTIISVYEENFEKSFPNSSPKFELELVKEIDAIH